MRLTTFLIFLSAASLVCGKPNLLIFLADDMSYHDLGCYGNDEVRTPHIDRFAEQGTRFTRCYNSSPMCAPTRMSLYTGIHPVRNGGCPNHSRVHDHVRSLPHHLAELGYSSGLLGKRHYKPEGNFPFEFLGGRHHDGGRGLDLDLSKAREFIDAEADAPWSLVVATNQPHQPWNRGDASAYDPGKLTVPPYLVDTPETREGLAKYYAEITYMDEQFGAVMRHLEESGEAGDTLVLFLGEQGSNFPYCKWTCYETGLRSSAIARWPGEIPAGRVCDTLVQYVDVVPTFVELAGGEPDELDLDGKPITSLLRGGDDPVHEHIFGLQTSKGIFEGPEAYGIRTVRDERYRLIWNLNHENEFSNLVTAGMKAFRSWKRLAETDDPFAASRVQGYLRRPEFELYDLREDPWEMTNLADDPAHADKARELRDALEEWMTQQGDRGAATERAALSRMPGRN